MESTKFCNHWTKKVIMIKYGLFFITTFDRFTCATSIIIVNILYLRDYELELDMMEAHTVYIFIPTLHYGNTCSIWISFGGFLPEVCCRQHTYVSQGSFSNNVILIVFLGCQLRVDVGNFKYHRSISKGPFNPRETNSSHIPQHHGTGIKHFLDRKCTTIISAVSAILHGDGIYQLHLWLWPLVAKIISVTA